jgi:hypothetical protein
MKVIILLIYILISHAVLADDKSVKDLYIDNYIKFSTPVLRAKISNKIPHLKPETLDFLVSTTTEKMAVCAYDSIAHYPVRYRELSISTIAEGFDLYKSADIVETLMISDITSEIISEEEVAVLVEIAKDKLKECMTAKR